jgi:hypothetical protein
MKTKNMKFKIQQNTDNLDITQKSLGLDAWVEGDSLNLLNTNRGLHIQIRHGGNKNVFEAANKLSQLLSMAPEMLEFIKDVVEEQESQEEYGDMTIIIVGKDIIKKAGVR